MALFHREILAGAFFWGSLLTLAYLYLGYPAIIGILSRYSPVRPRPESKPAPQTVSVVIVVFNGEHYIRRRIENLLAQDFPLCEIIVVSDGSTDGTNSIVAGWADPRVKLLARKARRGKAACIGLGIRKAAGEIIVLADVRQSFQTDTVSRMIGRFEDDSVGAVSGSLEIQKSSGAVATGVGAYWSFEKRLRHAESLLDSCIGCTGAVYAIRKALFSKIPSDTLLDDVVIPMQIALAGYRVVFEPEAIAFDPQELGPEKERIRKRRTLAGNFQMLFRYPTWMLPWKNRLWWELISHKYLRLAAPLLLAVCFCANLALLDGAVGRVTFACQSGFYGLALLGRFAPLKNSPLFSIPASFVFLNQMVVGGLVSYVRGENKGAWQAVPAAKAHGH
jgi:cellulose synthase/poly-beta-1,6-N-acetylglucosamine synthase-like glycosyltransferase